MDFDQKEVGTATIGVVTLMPFWSEMVYQTLKSVKPAGKYPGWST
jgi:hypothetical protein